jgi:D-glycero-D-manno-heptose 1,7-bisphosphate phosphatase
MKNNARALFLDRDGVINEDYGYVHKYEDFHFIDGIFELVKEARNKGYLVIVVTNQAGIGRGHFTEVEFHTLMKWVTKQFSVNGGEIDEIYFCPYHAEFGVGKYKKESIFRKPGPGMIMNATKDYKIDLQHSVLIGDKDSDMNAGISAGVGTNILFCPIEKPLTSTYNGIIINSLLGATKYLI